MLALRKKRFMNKNCLQRKRFSKHLIIHLNSVSSFHIKLETMSWGDIFIWHGRLVRMRKFARYTFWPSKNWKKNVENLCCGILKSKLVIFFTCYLSLQRDLEVVPSGRLLNLEYCGNLILKWKMIIFYGLHWNRFHGFFW